MCLSVPARIVSLDGATAVVEVAGNRREADVSMVADVSVGDYVLLHAGFAIGKYDQEDAEETLRLLEELAAAEAAERASREGPTEGATGGGRL